MAAQGSNWESNTGLSDSKAHSCSNSILLPQEVSWITLPNMLNEWQLFFLNYLKSILEEQNTLHSKSATAVSKYVVIFHKK